MNTREIKETFYKRYGASDNFLHYTFEGARCVLLGHEEIKDAPVLSCALSMGIGMLARRLDGNTVNLQAANSDRRLSYSPDTPPSLFQGEEKKIVKTLSELSECGGAEILYSSSMPEFLPQDNELKAALTASLHKVAGVPVKIQRSGYCSLRMGNTDIPCPLPLTGYKIVTAYCTNKKPEAKLRKLRGKAALKAMHHINGEDMRISAALKGLKRCDIKALFRAMNASQASLERYWNLGDEPLFLARRAKDTEGVRAARCVGNSVIMIVENDFVDYAVNIIGNDFEASVGYKPTFCVSEAI